jgi:outer membrane lipoprotein-sorting protein
VVSHWSILAVILLFGLASLACSKGGQPARQTSPPPLVAYTPPFKTKEPETYQAVRSITFAPTNEGQSSVATITIVKDGNRRREEDKSNGKTVVYLDLPSGSFVLLPEEKIYAEMVGPAMSSSNAEEFEEGYVHTTPIQSTYENLGTETVSGTSTTKYKVTVNSTNNGNVTQSETLIWIDDALGMPVKSVTRSASGTRNMELSQVTLSVDKSLLEIPKGYQKVEMQELQQRIR